SGCEMDVVHKPPCRLALIFAAKAPVTLILRRGPSRRVKMIVWNTKTDQFIDGEWWHGRIYAEKCGLSPDGRLFVYFGYQWKPRYIPEGVFAFTAVSRIPSFQPVALWPAGSFWGGGGRFLTNCTVSLNYGKGALPEAHSLFREHGLQVKDKLGIYCHPAPDEGFRLDPAEHRGADWLGKDHRGKLIFTRAGILYRLLGDREIPLRNFNTDLPPPIMESPAILRQR
ncbi:MAG TPA: hypothetical protein VJA21_26345, partial [Verrucomicrobiae bacterium]